MGFVLDDCRSETAEKVKATVAIFYRLQWPIQASTRGLHSAFSGAIWLFPC